MREDYKKAFSKIHLKEDIVIKEKPVRNFGLKKKLVMSAVALVLAGCVAKANDISYQTKIWYLGKQEAVTYRIKNLLGKELIIVCDFEDKELEDCFEENIPNGFFELMKVNFLGAKYIAEKVDHYNDYLTSDYNKKDNVETYCWHDAKIEIGLNAAFENEINYFRLIDSLGNEEYFILTTRKDSFSDDYLFDNVNKYTGEINHLSAKEKNEKFPDWTNQRILPFID